MQKSSDNPDNQNILSTREAKRLEALQRFHILDTLPEQGFEDIALLASHICHTPMALVSLVDGERQWFKAKVGILPSETPRSWSFCDHAIRRPDQLMVVPDAMKDARFSDNPLVVSSPHIRFYAGAPLVTSGGEALGTLCVIDILPRELSEGQQEALNALARQVMAQLELRQALRENEEYFETFLRPLISSNSHVASESAPLIADVDTIHRIGAWQQAILDSADLTIISTDLEGIIQTCNAGALRKLGYEAEEIIGKVTPEILHQYSEVERQARQLSLELDRPVEPGFEALVARARAGFTDENDWNYVRKDGSSFLVRLTVTALHNSNGVVTGFLGIGKDITQQIIAAEALKESEGRFQAFMNNGPMVSFIKDANGCYLYANSSLLERFNKRWDEFVGHCDDELWPRETYEAIHEHDRLALMADRVLAVEETTPMPDGSISYWLSYKFPLRDNRGSQLLGGIAIDISDRKEYERRLEELAVTDSLTNLKNHGAFAQRLSEEFKRSRRYNLQLSLLMLDVDYFKKYNDAFGHLEGDKVLRRVSELLREHARPSDFTARYGGEEFVIILANTGAEGALTVAERIRVAVEEEPFEKSKVTISLGIAELSAEILDMNALISAADAALYKAKNEGRNRTCKS